MKQHLLQLYDDSGFMLERVISFLRHGAEAGESLVVIATPSHSSAVESGLNDWTDQLIVRDARELLSDIMRGDRVDSNLFQEHVGGLFESASQGGGNVRGFGEMVALLWEDGNHDGAVRLERLWSRLSGADRYALICAYPLHAVNDESHGAPFLALCEGHSHVFPSEQVVRPTNLHHRIERLEREAQALRSELSRRLDVQHSLSAAGDSKDDFIAILSHELRNPLTPILTAVEMLRQPLDADQQQRLVATIGRQTSVLARLVEDLLDGSRLASGRINLKTRPLRLGDILEQAAESGMPDLERRGHAFTVECSQPETMVQGDEVRLMQALSNLLSNAAKFTPEGGRIWLKGEVQDGKACIEVGDSGRGMRPEFLARAFDPYVQATTGEGGLGLGLSIVRSIVRMHGGRIEASSAGPGLGTTFRISLPLARQGPPITVRDASSQKASVLVVDDNDDVRETLATLLQSYGHETRTAQSGPDALEQLRHRPQVVLLDLGMPGMDGYEVARQIRLRGAPPLLVALSGHAANDTALAAGFDHQFTKPPDVERLLRIVDGAGRQSQGTPSG